MGRTKQMSYVKQIDFLIGEIGKAQVDGKIDKKKAKEVVARVEKLRISRTLVTLLKHYFGNPEDIPKLLASYHQVRMEGSRRGEKTLGGGKAENKKHKSYLTAKDFLDKYVRTFGDDAGVIPGFDAHGVGFARSLLQVCAEVGATEQPLAGVDPADGVVVEPVPEPAAPVVQA